MSDVVTRRIVEHVVPGKRVGRHVEHDPRSRDYPVRATGAPLRNVLHKRHVPIYDQDATVTYKGKQYVGGLGSCTGNGMAGCLSTGQFTHHFHEPTAVKLYHQATILDGFPGEWPPDDTGSSGLAVAKAAQQAGYISSYQHAFTLDQALQALMNGPVITGTDWYTGMDQPDPDGRVHVTGSVRGGHEYCVLGVDVDARTVRFANSWSPAWGDNGYGVMSWDDWAKLLDAEGDVIQPIR